MTAAFGLSAALAIDLALGEPPERIHPVVAMGRVISALETGAPDEPRRARAFGLLFPLVPAIVAACAVALLGRVRPAPLRFVAIAWTLKSTFALRALLAASRRVERSLAAEDLRSARRELRALVSRPTADLPAHAIASAAIESLAENLCDSYLAPLLFYRWAGLPAALAYRAVNTADAMVGYRGRYEDLGKAAARLDDALNYAPARLTALALVAAAPLAGGSAQAAWRVALAHHRRTASPNAGWPMAAAAGALGLRLAKVGHYSLGDGREPMAGDIRRARRLVATAAALITVGALASYARAVS